MMRTDAELKADLMERIDSLPSINKADIEVFVDHGEVTLNGHVDTYQTRFQVERTARRVQGMRALQIKIKPTETIHKRGSR
ncbi:hypothetical protein DIC66_21340 [Rhodoferax lacus]|uniref:BON domain-containing protein n=1 Tax=Rhodoferax lacus TaxID=2184758 RepID=A0A3E1R6S2_9BURK|nr:BON domain-containing protein [Rhodoferax lacus]RFO94881.1 hypothetical protein DIC66_21340 [Rhodoferax lacus]